MGEAIDMFNERRKIYSAASWVSEAEDRERGDTMYRSFARIATFRRRLAQDWIKQDPESKNAEIIKQLIDKCNEDIKLILGI